MGTCVVPVGAGETEIMGLAKTFCRIADIQSRRFQGNVGPLGMEFEEARCRVEKLPKLTQGAVAQKRKVSALVLELDSSRCDLNHSRTRASCSAMNSA